MRMIKLNGQDGKAVWVKPEGVTSISEQPPRDKHDSDGALTGQTVFTEVTCMGVFLYVDMNCSEVMSALGLNDGG